MNGDPYRWPYGGHDIVTRADHMPITTRWLVQDEARRKTEAAVYFNRRPLPWDEYLCDALLHHRAALATIAFR